MVTWPKIFQPNDSTKKLSQMVLSQVTGNLALEVHCSLGETSEIFITRPCKMLCRSHDDQRAGSFFKQRISMALQIGNAACVLGTLSDRDAFEVFFLYQISWIFINQVPCLSSCLGGEDRYPNQNLVFEENYYI